MAKVRRLNLTDEARSGDVINYQRVWGTGSGGYDLNLLGKNRALRVSAVFGCIRILSENVSTLPLDHFIRRDGVKRPYRPRSSWLDFERGPWNKIDFLVQVMTSLLLDGNAYIATYRNKLGSIQWVSVLDPDHVTPEISGSGEQTFRVFGDNGQHTLGPFEITHVRGMTLPGRVCGVSPIEYARETIDLSLAANSFGSAFFANSAHPSVVMELDADPTPNAVEVMRDEWERMHSGAGNTGKLAIATAGAKIKPLTINPDDAQFLETRKFQVPDVARIFGVPAHLLAHADSPTFGTGIAEQNVAFVQHSLRPWVERIEQALSDAERLSLDSDPKSFISLNVNGLMRGDYKSRIASNVAAVREGILTINEARSMEDLPPVEWGDTPISVQVESLDENGNKIITTTNPGGGSGSAGDTGDSDTQIETEADLADALVSMSKIYLAVDKVVTSEEARQIMSQYDGIDLPGDLPKVYPIPADSTPTGQPPTSVEGDDYTGETQ